MPVIALLLDKDTDLRNVMKFPILYKKLLQGRELSIKMFLWWLWKSLYQATVIMIGALILFPDKVFLKIATITFTSLIFIELLNVYSEIKSFHRYMIFSLLGTLIVYCASLWLLKTTLDVYFIWDAVTFIKIFALALISWFPFFICYQLKSRCFPEQYEKLQNAEELDHEQQIK
jgi:phospholipid-translocating ATPase